jgi:uncharacterized membrane protein YphA (DoxX/SURF4 family)
MIAAGVARMSFPLPVWLTDVALFLLRLMVGIVFITSGYGHLKDPNARSKSIGMSDGTNGWSYDTMMIVMSLVIVATGGGELSLARLFK